MSEKVIYPGKDLEAMSFAVNYHKWIVEEFRPFLGKKIVEVGAGTGDFSTLLLGEKPESLSLIEPSEMFAILEREIVGKSNGTRIKTFHAIFSEVAGEIEATQKPDSIIYVNVMEHIENDVAELEKVYETLAPNGRVFIFVPALQFLYGKFDEKIGHFRRYTKSELEGKTRNAGFKIVKSRYFDVAGIAPWFVKYKLLKSDSLSGGAVETYDKFVVPVAKAFESLVKIPIGKNVLLIAEKQG